MRYEDKKIEIDGVTFEIDPVYWLEVSDMGDDGDKERHLFCLTNEEALQLLTFLQENLNN